MVYEDNIETKAWLIPYAKSDISNSYVPCPGQTVLVSSINDDLVAISLPGGGSAIVKASQLITACQKCVL